MAHARLALSLATIVVALGSHSAGLTAGVPPQERAFPEPSPPEIGDCGSVADLVEKEACYALVSPAAIEECESIRPFRCAPYRDMHFASAELEQLVARLSSAARRTYHDYATADAAYVDDLAAAITDAHDAWLAWRDADCALEPYLEGMARTEAADLTESCRHDRTQDRIRTLRDRIGTLEADGE